MKNQIINEREQTRNITKAAVILAGFFLAQAAFAAGGLSGGIAKTTSVLTQIKDALLVLGGIAAVIYLLWKAIEAWRGRADWGEFGMSVAYVALAGAAATIANWAWTSFQ